MLCSSLSCLSRSVLRALADARARTLSAFCFKRAAGQPACLGGSGSKYHTPHGVILRYSRRWHLGEQVRRVKRPEHPGKVQERSLLRSRQETDTIQVSYKV